jgi:hypothetical protein
VGPAPGKRSTVAVLGRAGERPVVARTDAAAVEVLGTVVGRGCPFADKGPKVRGGVGSDGVDTKVAGGL